MVWKHIATLLVAIVFWGGWRVFHFFEYGIDNAYAQKGAGYMVVNFMSKNDGRWPRNWEDLRSEFESGHSGIGGWSFEKYCSRVWIDFDADPKALAAEARKGGGPNFNVIFPADGIDVEWKGASGNQIVYEYLRWDKSARGNQPGKARLTR